MLLAYIRSFIVTCHAKDRRILWWQKQPLGFICCNRTMDEMDVSGHLSGRRSHLNYHCVLQVEVVSSTLQLCPELQGFNRSWDVTKIFGGRAPGVFPEMQVSWWNIVEGCFVYICGILQLSPWCNDQASLSYNPANDTYTYKKRKGFSSMQLHSTLSQAIRKIQDNVPPGPGTVHGGPLRDKGGVANVSTEAGCSFPAFLLTSSSSLKNTKTWPDQTNGRLDLWWTIACCSLSALTLQGLQVFEDMCFFFGWFFLWQTAIWP